MSKISKEKVLRMLSANLKVFYPKLQEHFMCPTCLTPIPLNKEDRITEAHIIPKAASGKLKTYLCNDCNSFFGRKQDKWFGERIRLVKEEPPTMFATDIRDGHFWIDNIKVNGHWEKDKKGGLSFYIHKDRNSPLINKLMKEKFGSRPPKINMQVSFPILKQKRMIDIGFLTAGYLMWFGSVGYSWVLQSHLNPIRDQILNPEKDILKTRFIAYCNKVRWKPWIGLITIADEPVITMGLENSIVIFPPVDRPQLYSELGNDFTGMIGTDIRPLQFFLKPYYGPAVCVTFDNRLLVAPDAVMNAGLSNIIIHFSSSSTKAQVLYPINKKSHDRLVKNQNTEMIRIDARHTPKKK